MATQIRRTDSLVQPALFKFDEHFELQGLIGASRSSEVRVALRWCRTGTRAQAGGLCVAGLAADTMQADRYGRGLLRHWLVGQALGPFET